MSGLQHVAVVCLAWLAVMWLACALMARADRRGEDDEPADIADPLPITGRQLLLAGLVVGAVLVACSAWPMGCAPATGA